MKRKSFADKPCSIARTLDVLGDWWNPLIIREAMYGVRRFDDIQRWLGIGRNILTHRLALLVGEGYLEKRRYQTAPERFEYVLTDKGRDASKVLIALMAFGEKWHFEPGNEPIRLFDKHTGKRVHVAVVDVGSGNPIDTADLYPGPGPGFPHAEDIQRARFQEFEARGGFDNSD
ncbi:MAG: helix-turn-helix domain-containing protein [Pseudomonadota bacterium]